MQTEEFQKLQLYSQRSIHFECGNAKQDLVVLEKCSGPELSV